MSVCAATAVCGLPVIWSCGQSGPAAPAAPGAGGAATQPGGITEKIHLDALAWFDRAIAQVDKMVPAAEAAVDRLIKGGRIYVAGGEGFCQEHFYRAGGFSATEVWNRHRVKPDDVILMGHFKANDSGLPWIEFDAFHRFLRLRNGLVVHFASLNWPDQARTCGLPDPDGFWTGRLHRFDTAAPAGESPQARALGQMATTALAWAFHAEMISGATRKGKTLATYSSDDEPNSQEWDSSVAGKVFHPSITVPAIPAGKLGKEYLSACREQAREFLQTEPQNVRLAARRMAACMKAGGVVWIACCGHVHRHDNLIARDLPFAWLGRDYTFTQAFGPERMTSGDMLLWMGYIKYPEPMVKTLVRRSCGAVMLTVEKGPDDPGVVQIRGCWKPFDTILSLPEYPIKVVPTSGVVQSLQWYSILGETEAAYKANQ